MKKVLRIGFERYWEEKNFEEHLEFIKRNLDVVDEVNLFVEHSHYGYWSPEFTAQSAEIIKDRMKRYKEIGVPRAGINLLCTIGHVEEGWDVLPRAELQYAVGADGRESKSCLCPFNEAFQKYITERYAAYANTGVDFIWIDDDFRIYSHGVDEICYCPDCITRFNKENNTEFDIDGLKKELDAGGEWKQKWEDFRNRGMIQLLSRIREAVKRKNPDVEIGYMSIGANAKKSWIEASGASMGRPGGGAYRDTEPMAYIHKSYEVMQQIQNYPESIKDLQYEYEAFNYQTLERSVHMSELESTIMLMSGCNGVLYNKYIFVDDQKNADMLRASADKWRKLVQLNQGCKNVGIYFVSTRTAAVLGEIGISVTPSFDNAVAAVVLGEEWNQLSDVQIKQVLDRNVFTDGKGLAILNERGFDKECGGKIKNSYDNGMAERFTDHDINGEFAHFYRNVYMNFFFLAGDNAYELEPVNGAECLSKLETITHIPAGCSMYRYENAQGMRFAADGYFRPEMGQINSAPKRCQMVNLLDWLSQNKLPVKIEKSIKVVSHVTEDENGGMNIMLTNASFDRTGFFECVVRSDKEFYYISQSGKLNKAKQITSGGESRIQIENIEGWNYVLLTSKTDREIL